MTFSTTPAGSAAPVRACARWLRGTALPAHERALSQVDAARARSGEELAGDSATAYDHQVHQVALRLQRLVGRLDRAAALCEAYAERLAAHEAVLADVRARAARAGLAVHADRVGPAPGGPTLLSTTTWSDLAARAAAESEDLLGWVRTHLDAAVAEFVDTDTSAWLAGVAQAAGSTVVAGTLQETLGSASRRRLAGIGFLRGAEDSDDRLVRGLARQAAKEGTLEALLDAARMLDGASRLAGPAGLTYDTVAALESDEPAEGLVSTFTGFGAGTAATTATIALVGGPVGWAAVVGGVTTLGVVALTSRGLDRLPDELTDPVNDWVEDQWDGTKEAVVDGWEEMTSWIG